MPPIGPWPGATTLTWWRTRPTGLGPSVAWRPSTGRGTCSVIRCVGPSTTSRAARRSDAFQDVAVSPAVGCALRIGPVILAVGLLFAILIVTALMTGDGNRPPAFQIGQCVHVHDDGMEVVPCIGGELEIVARGVAGTSCPMGAIAVVLPTRTEQVCVAPSVG